MSFFFELTEYININQIIAYHVLMLIVCDFTCKMYQFQIKWTNIRMEPKDLYLESNYQSISRTSTRYNNIVDFVVHTKVRSDSPWTGIGCDLG